MEELVSVIIPVHNRPALVKRALSSVVNQSFKNLELIVVDDGSTDSTPLEVEKSYPDVKLIKTLHRGVSAARNAGIKTSSGEYVAFLDSDDAWEKDKLKHQVDYLRINKNIRWVHTDERWIRNGAEISKPLRYKKCGGDVFFNLLELTMIGASTVMARADFFKEAGLFDEEMVVCEDNDLWLRMALLSSVGYIDEKLTTKYAGHKGQLSRTVLHQDTYRVKSLAKLLREGRLSKGQRREILEVLKKKLGYIISGLEKKGLYSEAGGYGELAREFEI